MNTEEPTKTLEVGQSGLTDGLGASPKVPDRYAPGSPCTVNTSGDMYMMSDARPFFGVPCVVVKCTKSGLIQVALADHLKITYSFPKRNVDL